jgi:hypothetical protein
MALSDFLTNGQIPAGSAATAVTKQTVLPDWYTNYAMQLLANQNAVSAQPYTTFGGPRVADFTGTQRQGFGMTQNAATAYQPALNQAMQTTQGAAGMQGGLQTAQPFMQQAGQSSVANIGQYMNPYTDQVVNRIGELAGRNLSENIMPNIEGRYVRAGQLGFGPSGGGAGTPSGMMTDTARAIRDTQEAVLAQQAAALQQGYGQALQTSGTDLARLAQLGGMAGGLAQSDIGQQLNIGQQMGGLGALSQQLGLTGAQAVTGVGQQQQALNQQNLDVAYGDFLRQQQYPQQQITSALQTLQGVQAAVPTATQEEGIVPLGYQPQYAPSTAASVAGGLAALAGLLK